MPDVATSLHLHNVHELTLLVPVKDGFVEQDERRISYATRLHRLLSLLFRPSQSAAEKTLMPVNNFADALQNIYHFDYGVVERFQQSQLILSASFDSSWETYFHNLVDEVGAFLDAVFSHCKGFEGRSCADGYEAFADFIREHQVQTGVLYTATPNLTTDDLRIFGGTAREKLLKEPALELEKKIAFDKRRWTERYRSPAWQGEGEYKRLRFQGIRQFFHSAWETRKLFPAHERIDSQRSAEEVFDKVAELLARPIFEAAIQRPQDDAGTELPFVELDKDELIKELLDDSDTDRTRWLTALVRKIEEVQQGRVSRHGHPVPELAAENIQTNILKSDDSNAALLTLLRFPTNDPEFVERLRKTIVASDTTPLHINAGFTFAGLRRLGLGDEILELFPKEFQEGMELRAGTLGDVGWPSHPDYWRPIGAKGWFSISSIDLVVVFHGKLTKSYSDIEQRAKELLAEWIPRELESCLVHAEVLKTREVNFFGFKNQPENQPELAAYKPLPAAAEKDPKIFDNRIAYGDLVLGYEDRRGEVTRVACEKCNSTYSKLFKDGSFLVVRKLAQRADAFESFRSDKPELADESTTLGKLLEKSTTYHGLSDEEYPRISHRRRVNPRTRGNPRIVRRSFSYEGPSADNGAGAERQEQGHLFMCYNASIAQQFEVLQRWINGGNSTNLFSTKSDLMGSGHVPHEFPINTDQSKPHTPHVTLRWGMYLFVPSKSALAYLFKVAGTNTNNLNYARAELRVAEEKQQLLRGKRVLDQLDAIKSPELAKQSWKQLFEEPTFARDAQAAWAVIRKEGGRKDTPYGVLIADQKTAAVVLEDTGSQFSVSKYRERFRAVGGDYYLGLDAAADVPAAAVVAVNSQSTSHRPPAPSYQALAKANGVFQTTLVSDAAFNKAKGHVAGFFAQASTRFDLRELARHVVGKISEEYIGLPLAIAADDVQLRTFLDHFINITRYSSFPYPEEFVRENAFRSGDALRLAYGTNAATWSGFGQRLSVQYGGDPEKIRDAMIIGNVGFVPPAVSMLVGMLTKWLNNGDIQQPLLRKRETARAAIIREMKHDPTFPTMYRTAVKGNPLNVEPGTNVIVGIQSAFIDEEIQGTSDVQYGPAPAPLRWMFGGAYRGSAATHGAHACPMQAQALEILAGTVTAVAEHIAKEAQAKRALVRLGPVTYELETIGRILPGLDLKK